MKSKADEFVLAGVAACGAGFFSNPLEVVKTRMQLQGELKARGHYAVHYRNVFHAFYTVAKGDGILALQKGLVPALCYQFIMNGMRLGSYQTFVNAGLTTNQDGSVSVLRSIAAGATSGVIGAFFGSPMYMIKTQLQAKSTESIAVGHQHRHSSMTQGIKRVMQNQGFFGLWRGVSAAMIRVMMGSAAQLTTFSKTKSYIEHLMIFHQNSVLNALTASMLSGVVVVAIMTPFDVISTRLYNQGVDSKGRGLLYKGFADCFIKIGEQEGLWGYYKGWAASLFRLGPHTVLSLVFWNELRKVYMGITDEK